MIQVRELSKTYGHLQALQDVSFTVPDGQWLVICGPNGAGKTTLLRILATLGKPTTGQVRVDDFTLPQDAQAIRRRIGFVSHLPLLYSNLTAGENLWFYAAMYGVPNVRRRVQFVLEQVGLSSHVPRGPKGDSLVRTFSRGMGQRLSIARALLHDPSVLLLDEPYTGLDPHAAVTLEEMIARMAHTGRTVILTTHNLERGISQANRVLILIKGRVVAEATGAELSPVRLCALYDQLVEECQTSKVS